MHSHFGTSFRMISLIIDRIKSFIILVSVFYRLNIDINYLNIKLYKLSTYFMSANETYFYIFQNYV